MAAYRKIPFVRFALGAVVVLVPALLLEQSGQSRWAWAYVALILLMMAVFYSGGLTRAANFTAGKLQKG